MIGVQTMVKALAGSVGKKLSENVPALFVTCMGIVAVCYMFIDMQNKAASAATAAFTSEHADMKKSIDSIGIAMIRLADANEKQQMFNAQLVEVLRANTEALRDATTARTEIARNFGQFTEAVKQLAERNK